MTDSLLPDQGPAKRPPMAAAPRVPARFLEGGDTDDALRAEHGFSALVTIDEGRTARPACCSTPGLTPDGLVENMRRLELSPARHRHHRAQPRPLGPHDRHGRARRASSGRANMPVLIHPEFWSRRRVAFPGREPIELPSTSRGALEGAGFEIVEERQPSFLLDGSLLVTGEVDRTTEFEQGFPGHEAYRDGRWQPDPLILDDQALVANVRGRGLVVLTGCGHSGIVNILRYVRKLTGEDRIHAVVGGFHLSGPRVRADHRADLRRARPSSRPTTSCPSHCTGWRATHALAARFPEAFIQNSVGTRFEFAALRRLLVKLRGSVVCG